MSSVTTLAVVGQPIAHSLSPALHNAAYETLGLPWKYVAVDVQPGQLHEFINSTDHSLRGLSVTMPHKVSALEAANTIDVIAERTHSVNTLRFDYEVDGTRNLTGYNTDVSGIVNAFADVGVASARHVAVIGGGATASSAVVAAAELGAQHISVFARTPQKAFFLEQVGQEVGVNVTVHALEKMEEMSDVDVAISTLPGDVDVSLASLPRTPRATLLDVAYNPWPSTRGAEWAVAGGEVVSGLRMLAHQALIQVRIFVTGSPFEPVPQESDVKAAMFNAIDLENI